MVFIVMTGISAAILFILSSWLQKMMNEHHNEFTPDMDAH
jgi:POT family proton-dependent oligopeptide transporter